MSHTNNSKLDFQQIIKYVYDSDKHRLRTDGVVSFEGGEQEVIISHLDDSIRLGDGTNFLTSTNAGAKYALDVAIVAGTLTVSIGGLNTDLDTSVITVTDTATRIPSSALSSRNTLGFRNWGKNTIFIGPSSVTAANGYPKRPLEEMVMDVTDSVNVEVYAICESGKTSEVRIIEIA